MDKKRLKGLIAQILRILDHLENETNQAKIQEIKGLINEILEL